MSLSRDLSLSRETIGQMKFKNCEIFAFILKRCSNLSFLMNRFIHQIFVRLHDHYSKTHINKITIFIEISDGDREASDN